jgi:membrane associated rhomboid family serine protease
MTFPSQFDVKREPAFNLPPAVMLLLALILGIHAVRVTLLSPETDLEFVFSFAFIPARVMDPAAYATVVPGGEGAAAWTFLTYALLHADWGHVAVNSVWLAAFGSPLAWRFGTTRFLVFSAAGAIGGALLHLLSNMGDQAPMVGASAAISAHMAGASRFVFTTGIPLGGFSRARPDAYRRPAAPLSAILRDRRVLIFLIAWFGINLIFGLAGQSGGLTSGAIAWQAHIGGFLTGLILFPLFDPVGTDPFAGKAPPVDPGAA